MSRIGKKSIPIPSGTEVSVSGSDVVVKGPRGTLKRTFPPGFTMSVEGGAVTVRPFEEGHRALWGTTTAHIHNMVAGVNTPFVKKLIVEGIGFKADVKGGELILHVGYTHPVGISIPSDLTVTVEKNAITVSGPDIESVGQFAAVVRSRKPPEPYKGKGIRYEREVIRRKQGKKTV